MAMVNPITIYIDGLSFQAEGDMAWSDQSSYVSGLSFAWNRVFYDGKQLYKNGAMVFATDVPVNYANYSTISNLTNTRWSFNNLDVVSKTDLAGFSVYGNFVNTAFDAQTFIGVRGNLSFDLQFYCDLEERGYNIWETMTNYVTPPLEIEIKGGNDVANSELIGWLMKNAQQIPSDMPKRSLTINGSQALSCNGGFVKSVNGVSCMPFMRAPKYLMVTSEYVSGKGYVYKNLMSEDAVTWSTMPVPTALASSHQFACVNGLYVAFFKDYANKPIYVSDNCVSWREVDLTGLLPGGSSSTRIREISARQRMGDFLVCYDSGSNTTVKTAITSDFANFKAMPDAVSRTASFKCVRDYFFMLVDTTLSTYAIYCLDEGAGTWVKITLPTIYTGNYSQNSWRIDTISYSGGYYRIGGKGNPSASSPIYRNNFHPITAGAYNPLSTWSGAAFGDAAGACSTIGCGGYVLDHITENTSWYSTNIWRYYTLFGATSASSSTWGSSFNIEFNHMNQYGDVVVMDVGNTKYHMMKNGSLTAIDIPGLVSFSTTEYAK